MHSYFQSLIIEVTNYFFEYMCIYIFSLQENPNPQPYVQKIPKPTEGAFTRIHQPTFPLIHMKMVQDIIDEGMSKQSLRAK